MKMGTCEQPQPAEQQGERETQREGLNMEENNLMITGPPASRTVIDNLKKLLLQRQHSRESDTENNRNITLRSDPGSNSDAAFYSQFSTSSSDSDSSDYMIFQEISNQEGCNNNEGRRKYRRRRSYSSSSSSSPSPVARCRRKVTRVNVSLSNSIGGGDGEASTVQKSGLEEQVHSNEYNDSANSTSSHKDSSSEDDYPGANNSKSLSSSEEVVPNRCAKLKSRRDRDRKRKLYELNYTSHRPKMMKVSDSTTNSSSRNEENSQSITAKNVSTKCENNVTPPTLTTSDTNSKVVVTDSSSPSNDNAVQNKQRDNENSNKGEEEPPVETNTATAQTILAHPSSDTVHSISTLTTKTE